MSDSVAPTSITEEFLRVTERWPEIYTNPGVTYIALKVGSELHLMQAQVHADVWRPSSAGHTRDFDRLSAGYIAPDELKMPMRELVEHLAQGQPFSTSHGLMRLAVAGGGAAIQQFQEISQEGLAFFSRRARLRILGSNRPKIMSSLEMDWALKAAAVPYDSVNELTLELGLGALQGDMTFVDCIAPHVAEIDVASKVEGMSARPAILMSRHCDPAKAHIGFQVLAGNKVTDRGVLDSQRLAWTTLPDSKQLRGEGQVVVPVGAAMHCYAVYDGTAQHQYWIVDPATRLNWRRAAYEEVDPQCDVLQDFLFESKAKRKEARDFEVGVASLFWMLGFAVLHPSTKRTEDRPDLLLATPSGDLAVAECTVDVPDKNDKMSKLTARTREVEARLRASGAGHVKVLPVLVTALTRAQVDADAKRGESQGIFVATRDELQVLFGQTTLMPNADQMFAAVFQRFQAARAVG